MNTLVISSDRNYGDFIGKKISENFSSIISRCDAVDEAVQLLKNESYQVIILCMPVLSLNCPFEAFQILQPVCGNAKVISIVDKINMHEAIQLIHQGMYTCLTRPFPTEELVKTIKSINLNKVKEPAGSLLNITTKKIIKEKKYVIGNSEVTDKLFSQINLVGPTSFSVIIYGETGTGKESVAQQIADRGKAKGPYITIDCGCLSKELALSEMFGHEKGSFTGAVDRKIGAFELANNGTLFLDEIGNLDYEVQGYLLRAIQERKIKRVGGTVDIPVSVRILVASNENLADAVNQGKFREDLYHRLNEFKINVPALRERIKELPLFIEHFLKETNIELNKNVLMPDSLTMMVLKKYDWRGNIRELRNVVRRACLLTPDNTAISFLQLPDHISALNIEKYESTTVEVENKIDPKNCKLSVSVIMDTLKVVNYNKTLAAQILGVDRKTIYNKLNKNRLNKKN